MDGCPVEGARRILGDCKQAALAAVEIGVEVGYVVVAFEERTLILISHAIVDSEFRVRPPAVSDKPIDPVAIDMGDVQVFQLGRVGNAEQEGQ